MTQLDIGQALCERELDLEMADVLPRRNTMSINIVVAPDIAVVAQTGVAIAINAASSRSAAVAAVFNGASITQY